MDISVHKQVVSYFLQQADLGIRDYIFTEREIDIVEKPALSDTAAVSEMTNEKNSIEERSFQEKRNALVKLYYKALECRKCSLGTTRKKLVFGAGNVSAQLMIIGEAPGFDEDMEGKPFVGRAGVLLTKMLKAINIDREEDVFISNILKCRPPENRNPNQSEISACISLLSEQIEIINPRLILLLGRVAISALLETTESISKLRLITHKYKNLPVVVTYHPAALLRQSKYKRPAWEDLQRLRKMMEEMGIYGKDKN